MSKSITITTDGPGSSVVRQRKSKGLSMRFRIRPAYVGQERQVSLYIRLSVNGQLTSDYLSGIKVPANKWDQTLQRVSGRSSLILEINERLGEVELQHREILRELKRLHSKGQGPRPTAALVKQEFVSPGSVSPTLAVWYMKYLDYLDTLAGTEDQRAEKTLARAYKTRDYIREFSGNSKVAGSPDKSPYLYDLTTGWGKRFHAWLQIDPVTGRQRMQRDSANKHLSHVRDAISYAVDEGNLSTNPLDKFRPKRGKGKEVYFLEPEHLDRLMGLTLDEGMGDVVWWAKLMCLTGLDYVDAVRYARNRADYEKTNDTGKRKICIDRSKPPRNYCEIWLLPEVEQLFKQYPTGPASPVLADINRNLKVMQVAIGFKPVLTSKICRKTAGAHFLRMGFQLSTVSKMLGHSSVRTTEDHYVKVMPSHVDQDIERVSRYSEVRPITPIIEREPFRRIA